MAEKNDAIKSEGYSKPILKKWGDVRDITAGGRGRVSDPVAGGTRRSS